MISHAEFNSYLTRCIYFSVVVLILNTDGKRGKLTFQKDFKNNGYDNACKYAILI